MNTKPSSDTLPSKEGPLAAPPGFLPDPKGITHGITLSDFPFSRLSLRASQLQAPAGYLPQLCFTPLLALVCNIWYIADNSKAIFYPIKVLLGHGYSH